MFRFANPLYLYLLLLIPVFVAIYVLIQLRSKKQLQKFGDPRLLANLMPDVSPLRRHLKFSLMMAALALLVSLMARPQYGTRNEEVKRAGIEVMIAVDVSNSMYCQDVNPSRLLKAKMIVSKLIEQFDEDKIGLVAFAGSSITLLPMTSDYVSAKMFLDQLSPASIANQGTNIAEAISRSVQGFSDKTNVGRALILITDAEDHEAGTSEAAAEARKKGVQIYVLSVGTEAGGPIPMENGEFKHDMNGNVVTTRLNEQVGKEIAKAGGGIYICVDQTNTAQKVLSAEIEKMQKADITSSMYSAFDEQFGAVGILLLIILIIECCIMERQNNVFRRITLFGARQKAVLSILLLLAISAVAQAQTYRDHIRLGNRSFRGEQYDRAETSYLKSIEKQPTFEAYYNLGNAYLLQGKDSTGVAQFMQADSIGTRNSLKRAMNFHNLGCVWYTQGIQRMKGNDNASEAFQYAVDLFKSSLRCNPDDHQTRYNLAMAQFMLKKSQQQQQQNGGGGDNKEDKKEDKKEDRKDEQQQQQQQQQQQEQNQMSDQNAQQMLNAAQQDEKNVQRKLKQQESAGQKQRNEKDW